LGLAKAIHNSIIGMLLELADEFENTSRFAKPNAKIGQTIYLEYHIRELRVKLTH
jgi:hypothetical protein